MNLLLYTAPTIEPISLSELLEHLRLDTDTFSENVSLNTCTAAGSHDVNAGYVLYGTGVSVAGKKAIVYLQPSNNGTGGTVDCKIQESADNVTYTDWSGGSFTQVTEANDTVIQEKEYTGSKEYIRTASKVLVAASEFGTTVLLKEAASSESDSINGIITTAREYVEDLTGRALLTQTWDYSLEGWPSSDRIKLPFGNLQSVTSVKYKDSDGTETTLTVTTDYIVGTNGDQCGYIFLPNGVSWPDSDLYPYNPITIRFVCGWTSAALVPFKIKAAIKLIAADLYQNREDKVISNTTYVSYAQNDTARRLLRQSTLWDTF